MDQLRIVTGPAPDPLVAFAADELTRYVDRLFGVQAEISAETRASEAVVYLDGAALAVHPPSDDQAFILRRLDDQSHDAFLAIGGSPVATLWAVYDLVGRWGVRYLLHGDVFPEDPGACRFPAIDETFKPNLRSRSWRLINDFLCGCESWGLEENCRFIDQITKLKYNEVLLALWPWQSYLHYEFRGVVKETGVSCYDFDFSIDEQTIGRAIFDDVERFENPAFIGLDDDYSARHEAAKQLAQGIIDHAGARGMKTGILVSLIEFPPEFIAALPGAVDARQTGGVTSRPGDRQRPDDPLLLDLVRTVIRATVQTYPDVDYLFVSAPEHRSWMALAAEAWEKLDARYAISQVMSLETAIANAAKRTQMHGGAERAIGRVKADIVMLYMLDQALTDSDALERPDGTSPVLVYAELADELWPLLPKICRPGSELSDVVDYTARRVVDQIDMLDYVPAAEMPSRFVFTFEDDNIGVLPQLAVKPLHQLATAMRERGWHGFMTRFWTIGCHDLTAHYLARSSWDAALTPQQTCSELAAEVCGADCVALVVEAWELIEAVTDAFDRHGLSFAFTVPNMMMNYWDARQPLDAVFLDIRSKYARAHDAMLEAADHTKLPGKSFVDYFIGRLCFAMRYIDAVEAVAAAGFAVAEERHRDVIEQLRKALAAMGEALEAYAAVAADNSDRGAVAALNKFCYRPIQAKLMEWC